MKTLFNAAVLIALAVLAVLLFIANGWAMDTGSSADLFVARIRVCNQSGACQDMIAKRPTPRVECDKLIADTKADMPPGFTITASSCDPVQQ